MNPVLAQTDADRDIAALTFTGLLRHDGEGNLIPALAEKYEVSADGLQYTVVLRDNLVWPDSRTLTADDVIFTINLAKNPQIQSPKRANWEGIEIEKIDQRTVRFHLRKAYAPFIENLTLGIIPKHLWENVPQSQFSLVDLNISPVGAGPYRVDSVSKDSRGSIVSMKLSANRDFVLGRPHIKGMQLYFYPDEETIIKNLQNGFLDSSGAVSPQELTALNKKDFSVRSIGLQRVIAVFFNQNNNKALTNIKVRQGLNQAIDKNMLVDKVLHNYGAAIGGPLPPRIIPPENIGDAYDTEAAQKNIKSGLKNKETLRITITTVQNIPEFIEAANLIKSMWEKAGVIVDVRTFGQDEIEREVIGPRKYEAFLYGEEVIGKNPDPFAFWHSSQRPHPGLNIALYTNAKIDGLLEKVRSEQNAAKQKEMYTIIQNDIKKDTPAVFLYSPSYLYITPSALEGFNVKTINTASERFETVHEWYLQKQYIWKIFLRNK